MNKIPRLKGEKKSCITIYLKARKNAYSVQFDVDNFSPQANVIILKILFYSAKLFGRCNAVTLKKKEKETASICRKYFV
jgi:hypothetical protein